MERKELFEIRVREFTAIWNLLRRQGNYLNREAQAYVEGFTFPCSLFYQNGIEGHMKGEGDYRAGLNAVANYEKKMESNIQYEYEDEARRGFYDAKQFLAQSIKLSCPEA
ncbi:hypothetical protein M199_gp207 [Halogranum tailed virus 1]|uniref:Uncharacterized protein n=1 Tax=Halogranum tailed virus 1 TaxID=1273749 RepID=R4T6Y2_9CAUD|nr:hypothetical protein M199_gp207 [Halogranum tailed virus 1]AGM11459.1 hypothetical protein HGTV1_162 [Halogranum tailed virus 1]